MSRGRLNRHDLIALFSQRVRRQSTWTVIYHQAVAEKMGLNPTDLKCWAVLGETGPITAGELAIVMGLTTGAVTGVIDRLEQAGFAQRDHDPTDRRRVMIVPNEKPDKLRSIDEVFKSLRQASDEMLADNYTNEQLEVILDFIERGTEMLKRETAKLREVPSATSKPSPKKHVRKQ
jgi:DNA-binding MarR family transcriptional regulator